MLNIKKLILALTAILSITTVWAQKGAQISRDKLVHNFGTISEVDGNASHAFLIKNTGDAPLVITRITVSCGCMRPEWSKAPIAPGKTSIVRITYNTKGRPGPFYKTVSIFNNSNKRNFHLAIKGNVTPKPVQPIFTYPYSFGDLKLHTKTILFSSIRPDEIMGQKINIKNEGKTPATIHFGKKPNYLNIEVNPVTLKPNETGEITVLMDAKEVKKKGRALTKLPIIIKRPDTKDKTGEIKIAANVIDNFSKMSAHEKAQAPKAELSGTLLEFGKLPDKRSFVPLIGGKVTGTFEITNKGKNTLQIYSVTCDDERVDLSGGKRELKPGATALFKVTVKPKEIKTKLETLINVVCNDPNGPIRLIKVTAYK